MHSVPHTPRTPGLGRRKQSHRSTASRSAPSTVLESQEERAAVLAFRRADCDGNGRISAAELGGLMAEMGHNLTSADLRQLIAQITTDDELNGLEEFKLLLLLYKEASQNKILEANPRAVEDSVPPLTALASGTFGSGSLHTSHNPGQPASPCSSGPDAGRPIRLRFAVWQTDSLLVGVWQLVMLLVGGFHAFGAFYIDAGSLDEAEAYYRSTLVLVLTIVSALCTIGDVALALRTQHTAEENIAAQWCSRWYCRWRLGPDLVTVLPWELIFAAAGTQILLFIAAHVKLWRALTPWVFYWQRSGRVSIGRTYIAVYAYTVPIALGLSAVLLGTHFMACVWRVLFNRLSNEPSDLSYRDALFFTAYTVTGVGFSHVAFTSHLLRAVACVYCIVSLAFSAFVVASIVSVMSQAAVHLRGRNQVLESMRIATIAGIGPALQHDMLGFHDHVVRTSLAAAHKDVVYQLPPELQENILLFVKVRLIGNDSVFQLAHRTIQVALAAQLETAVSLPGEAVFFAGDPLADMFFVAHGMVHLVDPDSGAVLDTVRSGGHLGERALLLEKDTADYTARCATHVEIFVLRQAAFATVCQRAPVFHREMQSLARLLSQMQLSQQQSPMSGDAQQNLPQRREEPSPRSEVQELPQFPLLLTTDHIMADGRHVDLTKVSKTFRFGDAGRRVSPSRTSLTPTGSHRFSTTTNPREQRSPTREVGLATVRSLLSPMEDTQREPSEDQLTATIDLAASGDAAILDALDDAALMSACEAEVDELETLTARLAGRRLQREQQQFRTHSARRPTVDLDRTAAPVAPQ